MESSVFPCQIDPEPVAAQGNTMKAIISADSVSEEASEDAPLGDSVLYSYLPITRGIGLKRVAHNCVNRQCQSQPPADDNWKDAKPAPHLSCSEDALPYFCSPVNFPYQKYFSRQGTLAADTAEV